MRSVSIGKKQNIRHKCDDSRQKEGTDWKEELCQCEDLGLFSVFRGVCRRGGLAYCQFEDKAGRFVGITREAEDGGIKDKEIKPCRFNCRKIVLSKDLIWGETANPEIEGHIKKWINCKDLWDPIKPG